MENIHSWAKKAQGEATDIKFVDSGNTYTTAGNKKTVEYILNQLLGNDREYS